MWVGWWGRAVWGEEGEREREGSGGEREGEWEPVEWVARFWALN